MVTQIGPKSLKKYVIHLRSAHTRRPVCTLRVYTFLVFSLLAQQAPCECSHPGWGGAQGPKGGDPGGQGAARGRTRAARAHGRTRALRALGPFGPLGPLGAKGDRLYATNAMPNGIDNTDERYSVNVSRFPPVWIPYERAFVGIIYFVQEPPICLRPK